MSESRRLRNSLDDQRRTPLEEARAAWISELSKSVSDELRDKMTTFLASETRTPKWRWLRRPEIGLLMTRGRAGGEGRPFNLGEITVTRCALRLDSGEEGVSYVLGRAPKKAELAALADALLQTEAEARLRAAVIDPLRESRAARERAAAAKAAETRVEFFTLARESEP